MDAKLTIKLDKEVIDLAKKYANQNKKSLSRMIETYLQSLMINEKNVSNSDFEISPFVLSISAGKSIPADLDYKKIYSDYLIEKYK